MKETALEGRVYAARSKEFGTWEALVRAYPLNSIVSSDARRFFKFQLVFEEEDGTYSMLLGWAHPQLLFLFRHGPVNLFIDCTFRVVPAGFKQLMIIMIYSAAHKTYVPVFFVLLQSKTQLGYWNALNQVIIAAGFEVDVKSVTCDFEIALINAVKEHFIAEGDLTPAELVCCCFHFLQAVRRKLVKLHLPVEDITDFLAVLRVLTVIPEAEVENKGIAYVRSKIDEAAHPHVWTAFWPYFISTWLGRYEIAMWNVHRLRGRVNDGTLINMTNNPLERFNGILNQRFGTGRPNMTHFVETLRSITTEYTETLDNISTGRAAMPVRDGPNVPTVPADYNHFNDF